MLWGDRTEYSGTGRYGGIALNTAVPGGERVAVLNCSYTGHGGGATRQLSQNSLLHLFQSESASVHSISATGTLFRQALWKFATGARISTLLTDLE